MPRDDLWPDHRRGAGPASGGRPGGRKGHRHPAVWPRDLREPLDPSGGRDRRPEDARQGGEDRRAPAGGRRGGLGVGARPVLGEAGAGDRDDPGQRVPDLHEPARGDGVRLGGDQLLRPPQPDLPVRDVHLRGGGRPGDGRGDRAPGRGRGRLREHRQPHHRAAAGPLGTDAGAGGVRHGGSAARDRERGGGHDGPPEGDALGDSEMNYDERKPLLREVEQLRPGRRLVCFLNFDRQSEPRLPGLSTLFHADVKEALFRVLKESDSLEGIDLLLYTRGGDTNAVWPLVSLVREFDPDFEVLVPFRCHSSGTLAALGANRLILTSLSELSPIDPSTGNQFNPRDPADPTSGMAISVEDVRAYRSFILEQLSGSKKKRDELLPLPPEAIPLLQRLTTEVHPLALGNVNRVLQQIKQLAVNLLNLHPVDGEDVQKIVEALTTQFFSHLHMINRHEAKDILGDRVEFASRELSDALDNVLRAYEEQFALRRNFYLMNLLDSDAEKPFRFIGASLESVMRSYLFETKGVVRQVAKPPANIQVQVPAGQPIPLVPGMPRETQVEVMSQGWVHNKRPQGVTK